MALSRFALLLCINFGLSGAAAHAQTFVIGDSNTTVNLPAGVTPGSTISFQGNIIVPGARGVEFTGVPNGVSLIFESGSTTSSDASDAVLVDGPFNGRLTNSGTIVSNANQGIEFFQLFTGTFLNEGSLTSTTNEAVSFASGFTGAFTNTGNIEGRVSAIEFDNVFTGTFTNSGNILSTGINGVLFDFGGSGTFINNGTITAGSAGVEVDGRIFTGTFQNNGTIIAFSEGIFMDAGFSGTFSNTGTLRSFMNGVEILNGGFTGSFTNSGTILSTSERGILVNRGGFNGTFLNTGTIQGRLEGVEVDTSAFTGTFTNAGTILSTENDGVLFDLGFNGTFINTGTIRGDDKGVQVDGDPFVGTFLQSGTVLGDSFSGIDFDAGFSGTFNNSGSIISLNSNGIEIDGDSSGSFTNSGLIRGSTFGVNIRDDAAGSWLNTGIIEGQSNVGFRVISPVSGTLTLTNRGGRITGVGASIELGADNGTVILEGPSNIQGTMFGGTGTGDTLRFQNIRGISDAKREELEALVGADPTQVTTINLFGEEISFTEFENVQVDLASIQSYEDILRPGLQDYGRALDNVIQLTDEIREFLSALNEASLEDLNEIAGTTSGQVIVSGTDDFVRHQDTNIFNLFTKEFSTLRNDPSGGGSLAANERSGLFTRDVQVGAKVIVPDDHTHAWVAGYVGNGSQDPDLLRSESDIDNTSILFGASQHVSNEWMLGFWGGYVDNDATVDRFGSQLRNEAGYVGINANYLSDDLFANFLLGYGFHDQLSVRRDFQGSNFRGDTVGNQALLQAQVGRDFFLGEESNLKASPYLGFAVSALAMGGFTENGNNLTRLTYEAETTVSAQSVIGVNLSTYRETKNGWIQPTFDAAWWHEFAGADDYGVSLTTPGFLNAFTVTSPVANRDRAVIQAGLRFGFDCWENVSFDATYFGTFGSDDYSSHGGGLSATFEF